jgi:hypothetical protein
MGTGRTLLNRIVILACLVVLAGAAVKGTAALYLAKTAHAGSTYNTGAVYDPSAITGAPLDNTEQVSWTDPGHNNGNGNGFAILAYHQGPTANTACSTNQADYTFVKGVASNVVVPVIDNGVFGGSNASFYASYTCYMVRTWDVPGVAPASWTSATVPTWTSQIAPAPANQYVTPNGVSVGFFPVSVTMANNNGTPASGDTITIVYNQATNAPNLTGLNVCFLKATGAIYIGQNIAAIICDTTGGTSVGVLTGNAFSTKKDAVVAATYAWSNANKTLTVTLGAVVAGTYPSGMSGTATFTASQAPEAGQAIVKSADGTIFPCNANHSVVEGIPPGSLQTNVCLPTTATKL